MKKLVSLVAACLMMLALPAIAADWPQWRGPDRTDVSKETGLLKSWPKQGPKLLWTYQDAGIGFSGPAIVGNRLYTMGSRNGTEMIIAIDIDIDKVKEAWSVKVGPLFEESHGDGPRCTPTVDGELLYALGAKGDLVCVETAGGKERWRLNMKKDLGGKVMSNWGYTESPLVDGDKLVCTPGGSKGTFAALDKKTGKVIWRSKDLTESTAYSSIIIAQVGKIRQYINMTGKGVAAVSMDGKFLWKSDAAFNGTAIITTPIFYKDHVYASSGYNTGCGLVKLTENGDSVKAEKVFNNDKTMANQHGGVILVGDNVYGYSDGKGWVCQDVLTGKSIWAEKKLGKGSLTCAEGKLYCYSEDNGTCVLIDASPSGWKESGRFKIPQETKKRGGGKIWTHPVIADGKLYLRDQDLIFCFDIKDGKS